VGRLQPEQAVVRGRRVAHELGGGDGAGAFRAFERAPRRVRSSRLTAADLANDQARKRPPDIKDRAGLASDVAIERIRNAVQIVATKAPEDLEDFTSLLRSVAQAMAEEVDGVSEKESEALARVEAALANEEAAQ